MDTDTNKTQIVPSETIVSTVDGGETIVAGAHADGTIVAPSDGTIVAPNDGTTVAPPDDQGGTVVFTPNTQPPGRNPVGTDKSKPHKQHFRFSPGNHLNLSGDLFTIESTVSSGTEAELYVVAKDGIRYAAKLYRPGFLPNSKVMPSLLKIQDENIVRCFQSGLAYCSGTSAPYELMEYCSSGATNDRLFKGHTAELLAIAYQIGSALSTCHLNRIIHKDVKPANILLKQEFPVKACLCDFGIADLVKSGEKEIITSQSRTAIYAAPEVYDHDTSIMIDGRTLCKITDAADYYSLGMAIVSLWVGEKSFSAKEEELAFQKRQGKIQIPRDMPRILSDMVQGLTNPIIKQRWDFQKIKSYLSGALIPIVGQADTHGILYDICENKIIENLPELADYLSENRRSAQEKLYRGELSSLLKTIDPQVSKDLTDIVERRYPNNQSEGLNAALFTLNPDISLKLSCASTQNGSINTIKVSDSESLLSFVHQNPFLSRETQELICSDMFTSWLRPRNREYATAVSKINRGRINTLCKAAKEDEKAFLSSLILWSVDPSLPFYWPCKLYGKNKTTFETEEIFASSPDEVGEFCCTHFDISPNKSKITSDLFIEWVGYHNNTMADRLEKVDRAGIRKYAASDSKEIIYRLIIQTMDPFADINLCRDIQDPRYAMTGESIGKVVNEVFNVFYSLFKGSMTDMKDRWNDEQNPLYSVMDFTTAKLIVNSFVEKMESHKASYLIGFMKTKGDRFTEQINWVNYCTDTESKIGPKYSPATAMIKAVAGLGHVPDYIFFESNEIVRTVDDLKLVDRALVNTHLTRNVPNGLKGWLAVQFQDNPSININNIEDNYVQLLKYFDVIGYYDSSDLIYRAIKDEESRILELDQRICKAQLDRRQFVRIVSFLCFLDTLLLLYSFFYIVGGLSFFGVMGFVLIDVVMLLLAWRYFNKRPICVSSKTDICTFEPIKKVYGDSIDIYNNNAYNLKAETVLRYISIIYGIIASISYPLILYLNEFNIYYQVFAIIIVAALLLSVALHSKLRQYE